MHVPGGNHFPAGLLANKECIERVLFTIDCSTVARRRRGDRCTRRDIVKIGRTDNRVGMICISRFGGVALLEHPERDITHLALRGLDLAKPCLFPNQLNLRTRL